ncbi:MAG: rhodanese-like domain-containing protein [Candidatus Moranbacteria bacterium]|nr:rhodanese-like domain-containing protein [Candidatus Moranbacteria bacterium]MDD3965305.1 rhodanese-like domain-containing protein [Candidatus Moranbacteria bacterium]
MATLFIDVRTKEEYKKRHVTGAMNLPVEEIIDGKLGMLHDMNRDTVLYLYCRSGGRAEKAKEILFSLGFTNVSNLGWLENAENFSREQ